MRNHIMLNNEDFFNNGMTDISEEYVASWIDRNLSPEEDKAFAERLSTDAELSAILDSYDDIESEYETMMEEGYELPEELAADFELPYVETQYFEGTDDFMHDNSVQSEFEMTDVNTIESDFDGDEEVQQESSFEGSDEFQSGQFDIF